MPMTTQRLELQAGILGLKLTTSVERALFILISDTHVWSDDMDVLYWIRGKRKQYRPFVENRICEIQYPTNP